jgi:hypothetical protein
MRGLCSNRREREDLGREELLCYAYTYLPTYRIRRTRILVT